MNKVYYYLRAVEFPDLPVGGEVASKHQLSLPLADHEACTTLTMLGLAEDPAFRKYKVVHHVEREVEGIFRQEPLRRFLEVKRFPVYQHIKAGYVLAESSKEVARSAFKRLRGASPPVITEKVKVELSQLQSLGETTGGWFNNLRIADVSTAGLFGTSTVTNSSEWKHYAEDGELNAVLMRLVEEGEGLRSLMLTKDRLVVLHKDLGEGENLRYLRWLQETIDSVATAED